SPSSRHCSLHHPDLHSFPTRRSSDLAFFEVSFSVTATATGTLANPRSGGGICKADPANNVTESNETNNDCSNSVTVNKRSTSTRSEEHTSELQSRSDLVCRLLLEKKK